MPFFKKKQPSTYILNPQLETIYDLSKFEQIAVIESGNKYNVIGVSPGDGKRNINNALLFTGSGADAVKFLHETNRILNGYITMPNGDIDE